MGRAFIFGIVKTNNLEKWYKEAQDKAAYEHGHSYSGQINMLDTKLEYTEYQFKKDFHIMNNEELKEEIEYAGTYSKISLIKYRNIIKKHNPNEITFEDFKNYCINKKLLKWKKAIIQESWRAESDIFYYIPIGNNKYYWFGYARC